MNKEIYCCNDSFAAEVEEEEEEEEATSFMETPQPVPEDEVKKKEYEDRDASLSQISYIFSNCLPITIDSVVI